MTDLGAVLRLPGAQEGLRHRAGPPGTTHQVTGVRLVHGHPQHFVETEGTLYMVLETDLATWRWDGLIRAAADVGAAAIVTAGEVGLEEPSELLADRLGTPIYRLRDGDTTLLTLTTEVVSLLAAPMALATDLMSRFTQAALSSTGEPAALLRAAGQLGAVTVWAWMPGQAEPLVCGELTVDQVPPAAPVADERVRAVAVQGGKGFQLATRMESTKATVGVAPNLGGSLSEGEVSPLLYALALALRAGQAQRLLADEGAVRATRDLLDEILSAGSGAGQALEQRAEQAGIPLSGWQVGFAVAPNPDMPQATAATQLHEALREERLQGLVVPRGGLLTGCVGLPRRPDAATRSSLSRRFRAAVSRVDAGGDVAVGIGRPSRGIEGLRITLDEAREVLDIAARRPQGARFVTIDALGIAGTVRSWAAAPGFRATARHRLEPILDADELLTTLRAYLDQALNVTATAQALGVHRNTVMTRVARVESLLETTLDDPEERLALHLAVRATDQ